MTGQISPEFINQFTNKFSILSIVPESEILQYRYAIDVDGNSNGWFRLRYILCSNSLCIKHKTPYKQWYYSLIIPGVHYLEVERDFSDLIEKIDWLNTHEDMSLRMILNSNYVAQSIFTEEAQIEYLYKAIEIYTKRFF